MAPHPYLDASVVRVTYIIALASGGYQDLPSAAAGGFFQKCVISFTLLLDNLTSVLFPHDGSEFKSLYKSIKWNLPFGKARHVDCRYPITLASCFLFTHLLRYFANFSNSTHF